MPPGTVPSLLVISPHSHTSATLSPLRSSGSGSQRVRGTPRTAKPAAVARAPALAAAVLVTPPPQEVYERPLISVLSA